MRRRPQERLSVLCVLYVLYILGSPREQAGPLRLRRQRCAEDPEHIEHMEQGPNVSGQATCPVTGVTGVTCSRGASERQDR